VSEKLKPNFTPIPNVVLDEMMWRLAPGATKILFAICRFTYGWGKHADRRPRDPWLQARPEIVVEVKKIDSAFDQIAGANR
jgi:hypothetical protein